jgi:hypothetical protein
VVSKLSFRASRNLVKSGVTISVILTSTEESYKMNLSEKKKRKTVKLAMKATEVAIAVEEAVVISVDLQALRGEVAVNTNLEHIAVALPAGETHLEETITIEEAITDITVALVEAVVQAMAEDKETTGAATER